MATKINPPVNQSAGVLSEYFIRPRSRIYGVIESMGSHRIYDRIYGVRP